MTIALGIGAICGVILILWLLALAIDAAERLNEEEYP